MTKITQRLKWISFSRPLNNKNVRSKIWIVGTLIVSVLTSLILLVLALKSPANYAEETARPIEQALIKAGAVKKSSNGDSGRGVDNDEPWYDAHFSTNLTKKDATILINQTANENGYNLRHASPGNRGHLGAVSDEFISNWYFDNTSKIVDYPNMPKTQLNWAWQLMLLRQT